MNILDFGTKKEMAHVRDVRGNPVQLTDEYGNPVKLTDRHGNPVQLTGVATTTPQGVGFGQQSAAATGIEAGAATTGIGTHGHGGQTGADLLANEPRTDIPVHDKEAGQLRRSGSPSSSSSSEDDGHGGRRKKTSMKDKIKEKVPGAGGVGTTTSTFSSTTAKGRQGLLDHPTHQSEGKDEKKGVMEKMKEKLPGHHSKTHH